MEFTALSDLVTDVRRRVRDFADSRWSREDKIEGLRSAVRQIQGRFAVEAVYTSVSFAPATWDYPLPQYVRRITKVERRTNLGPTGDSLLQNDWRDLVWWDLRPTPNTNFLIVDVDETALDVRVWYLDDVPPLPPAQMSLTAAIAPAQTTLPVGPGSGTLNISDYPARGWLQLRSNTLHEVVYYEGRTNTSFLNVARGLEGTANSFPAGTLADPVVIMDRGGAGYEFLVNEAMAQLYQQRMNDAATGDGQEVNFLLRWTSQRGELIKRMGHDRQPTSSVRLGKRGRFF